MKKIDFLRKIENIIKNKIFIVGGTVRDLLLGIKPKDIDIASAITPQDAIKKLEKEFKIVPTGIDHGTITIIDPETGFSVEHTTFRKDIKTDGRRAVVEFTKNIDEDLKRRDFTINSIALTLDGKIIDPFGGKKDLQRKIIRSVGNPEERFKEDFLRILRAARFSVKYKFDINEKTKIAMKNLSSFVEDNVSAERIRNEFLKSNSEFFAGWMSVLGIWKDLSDNWFHVKNPSNILVELAVHSNINDFDKYKFTRKEKRLIKLYRHAVNENWKAIYSARNEKELINNLKILLKKYSNQKLDKVDKVLNVKSNSKDSLMSALNNF